jgi:Spy/CpxP family protein refolding chaperone
MAKFKRLFILAIGSAAFILAQEPGAGTSMIYPPPVSEPGRALREFLNLSPTQSTALQEVQKSKRDAQQAVFDEMNQKQTSLDNLLRSGSTDYVQIGRLTVELRDLQKKIPVSGEQYRTRALSVLTQDQRAKLPILANALELQWPANDAVTWNLIDPPQFRDPIILPAAMSRANAAPVQ